MKENWQAPMAVAALGLMAGCGDAGDTSLYADLTDVPSEEGASVFAPLSSELAEEKFRAALSTRMSDEDRELIARHMVETLHADNFSISGTYVILGDVYVDAGELLPSLRGQDVEKGGVLATTAPPYVPYVYARSRNANDQPCAAGSSGCFFQFKRPDLYRINAILLPSNAPPWLETAFQKAVNAITAAADDCLSNGIIRVLNQNEWAQYGPAQADVNVIYVVYDTEEVACPNSPGWEAACAEFPQYVNSRFRFGDRIGVRNDTGLVNADTPESVAILTHEVLHTMGLAHQNGAELRVPGSELSDTTPSIMRGVSDMTLTLSADDKYTIDMLYSPNAGGAACTTYTDTFERIVGTCTASCTKMSTTNVAGDCCTCNGVQKTFIKSPWSATTFLCQ